MTSERNGGKIQIEVAYAARGEQALMRLTMEDGATVRDAVERSGILQRFPEINLARAHLGIFGKVVPPDTPVCDGDRVEIYRPLIADPKGARRQRAQRARARR